MTQSTAPGAPAPERLLIHHFEPASRANGPGLRAVLWVQGCAFGCPGCFNPETHDFHAGEHWTVAEALERIQQARQQYPLEGLTISGGEPLQQHHALATLLAAVRAQTNLSILVFTGYDWDELQRLNGIQRLLASVDVLLAGRYDASKRVAKSLLGSSNKTVHYLTPRYTAADLAAVPQAEVIIAPDGDVTFSGIDPLEWEKPGGKGIS